MAAAGPAQPSIHDAGYGAAVDQHGQEHVQEHEQLHDIESVHRLLKNRRSIRRYADHPVDRSVLEGILTCATWAPSAHNRQPWRFCVVSDMSARRYLADALGCRWAEHLTADGVDQDVIERRVAISRARITAAGVLVIASMCMDDMDCYSDATRQAAEHTMAVQSVALACQNLLLAAHAYGLGACWMCAPLFVPDLVRTTLDLPDTWEPQAMITLGHPAEERESTRRPLEDRVMWR